MDCDLLKHKLIHNATLLACRADGECMELSKGGMTKDSSFYIASISKLYTHAMIFQLIDQGALYYETKLMEILPDIARHLPYGDVVTVRHMIDQTSGFANYEMDRQPGGAVLFKEILQKDRAVDFGEALQILKTLPHKFTPGAGRRAYYADINAMLLGRIIELMTNTPLDQVLETMICRRLDLKQTHYAIQGSEQVTPIYNGTQQVRASKYLATQKAQGGIVATNAELMKFTQAFFCGRLFDEKHIASPTFRPIQFVPMKYGSGMMQLAVPRILSPFVPAPEIRGHSGSTGSFAYYCPSRKIFITGTINQLKYRPYGIIYRSLQKAIAF